MNDDKQFELMVDACLKANVAVVENGTPAMIAMMRTLLWQLGKEAIQREARAEKEALRHLAARYTDTDCIVVNLRD